MPKAEHVAKLVRDDMGDLFHGEVAARVGGLEAGARVEVALFRRDELLRVEVAVGAEAEGKWRVEPVEGADEAAVALRRGWLGEVGGAA